MNRLAILCALHSQQGGTMAQYERTYQLDFLRMGEKQFLKWVSEFVSRKTNAISASVERLNRALNSGGVAKELYIGDAIALLEIGQKTV